MKDQYNSVLNMILLFLFEVVLAQTETTTSESSDKQIQLIIALIIAAFLLITIVVIIIIILLSLTGKSKKKHNNVPKFGRYVSHKDKDNHLSNELNIEPNDQLKPENNKPLGSGSFVFSGYSPNKPIPLGDTYATAFKDNKVSDSEIYKQRPTDLAFKKDANSGTKSAIFKVSQTKTGNPVSTSKPKS